MQAIARKILPGLTVMLTSSVVVTAPGSSHATTQIHNHRIELERATSQSKRFRSTPEVNLAGGQITAQKIEVRCIDQRLLNAAIDGARQPQSAYHHGGQLMIEPALLKQVEIETGSATVDPDALITGRCQIVGKDKDGSAPHRKLNTKVNNAGRFRLSHERYQHDCSGNKKTNLIQLCKFPIARANNQPIRPRIEYQSTVVHYDLDGGNPLLTSHLGVTTTTN